MKKTIAIASLTLALLAAPAAHAVTLTGGSAFPWQQWADASKMPEYPGTVQLIEYPGNFDCGGGELAPGCAQEQLTDSVPSWVIRLSTSDPADYEQGYLWHELGHVDDDWLDTISPALSAQTHAQFMALWGLSGNWWDQFTDKYGGQASADEWWAEAYRLCSEWGVNVQEAATASTWPTDYVVYGFPGLEQTATLAETCQLIISANSAAGLSAPEQRTYSAASSAAPPPTSPSVRPPPPATTKTPSQPKVTIHVTGSKLTHGRFQRMRAGVLAEVNEYVEPTWASAVTTKPFKFTVGSGRYSGYRLSFVKHSKIPLAGFHDVNSNGPFAVINLSIVRKDNLPLSAVVSHEIDEMAIDPNADSHLGGKLLEVCDPVVLFHHVAKASARLDGVTVSDFVYPAWFTGGRSPYDFAGEIHRAAGLTKNGDYSTGKHRHHVRRHHAR